MNVKYAIIRGLLNLLSEYSKTSDCHLPSPFLVLLQSFTKMATDEPTKQKLWGGRFTGKTDPLMHAFNQSLSYDKRMHDADIRGSIAYAKSLCLSGLLTKEEEEKIVDGLQRVGQEWKNGTVCDSEIYS